VLASQIGSLDQTEQVVAKIKRLTESLPLLDTLPPRATTARSDLQRLC